MNTSPSTLHRAGASAVLAGAAVVLAVAPAPAYAGPYPVDDGATGPRSPRVVEREGTRDVQHSPAPTPAPTAQQPATRTPGRSDPSSVPVTVIALLGGSLVLGAAGFTVYRFRHHGPAGAATA